MHTSLENFLKASKRLHRQAQLPRLFMLGAAEQTRLSWARCIESFDEVPPFYQSFLLSLLGPARRFPYAVLTPTFEGFLNRANEKLVFSLDHTLYILERAKNKLIPTCYSFHDIHYVEVGSILLKAWIHISGVSGDGALSTTTLKFNTVTDFLFTPLLEKIRAVPAEAHSGDYPSELSKFNYLERLNFKFMNYAKSSIMPGEKVVHILLQPEIRSTILRLLGKSFSHAISTAHISILTDRELIMIREENNEALQNNIRYGGIWVYIPLEKIRSASLTGKNDLLTLSIQLLDNDYFELIYTSSNRSEVDLFLQQLEHKRNFETLPCQR